MKLAILLSTLSAAPMLLAQPRVASVEGRVVNAVNGSPVRRATVALRLARTVSPGSLPTTAPGSQPRVETDDQGRFAFRDLPPGGYVCVAERQGFVNEEMYPRSRPAPMLIVGEGQQVTGIVVRLTPQGVIAGKVQDRFGEPVQMVQVLALRSTWYGGRRQLSSVNMSGPIMTNDLGEYRIPGLAPGSYYVAVSPQGGRVTMLGSDSKPPATASTTTFYPAALDASAATPVRIEAGGEARGIDIKLAEVKAYSVGGRVIDPSAPPSRLPTVFLMRQGTSSYIGSTGYPIFQGEGRFLIAGVPAGSYRLIVHRRNEQGPPNAAATIPIEITDRSIEGLEVKVEPPIDIQGTVRNDGSQPCTGGNVALSDDASGYQNAMISGGSFSLKGIARGVYRLNVQTGGPCYPRSIRFGGREVSGEQLTVNGPGALEIVLATADSTIEGTVTDASGKPLDATVVAVAKDGGPQGVRSTYANRRGYFSLFGLRPGGYDVYAFEAVEYTSAQSPDYLKQFAGRGGAAMVAAGDRASVTLSAIPASATGERVAPPQFDVARGSVEGRVVNSAGAPVAGAKVSLSTRMRATGRTRLVPTSDPPPEAVVDTDPQGRFAFPDVEPEVYYVGVEKQGFLSPAADTMVVGNGQKIVGRTVVIEAQAVITGRIQDDFGDPVTNADVALYRPQTVAGVRRLYRVNSVRTDDLGKFRLAGLTAGTYDVAVSKRPMRGAAGEMGLPLFWSNGVVVASGAEVPLELVMRRTRVFRVRGIVVDEQDRPVERQQAVGLSPTGIGTALSVGNTIWLPGGGFEITGVPPGTYVLWVRPAADGPPARLGTASVEVRDANVDGLRVRMSAGKEVRGRLVWEGDPVRFGSVTIEAVEGYTASSSVTPDGSFRLSSVWPVPYVIRTFLPCPNCYVKSVRYAGREVADTYVTFDGDGELEITARADGGVIAGTAAPAIAVKLEGEGKVLDGRADGQGAIVFPNLKPGVYKLTAGSMTVNVKLEANGRADVTLK